MAIVHNLLNSLLFWSAWIIIPVIVEILPAIGSIALLVRRKRKNKNAPDDPIQWPEISLIIPVYNSEATLANIIKSIDASTYPNEQMRLFLVDNGCADGSFAEFARCQDTYSDLRMQWLKAEQGKSKALNMALFNSEGKYIINLDSDGVLEPRALCNMVRRFETDLDLNCMTGAVLVDPKLVQAYKSPLSRLLRKLEFMEYAQSFLAGRSYASETNSLYTLSGAFSAFRKSAILESRMYNTNTVGEDTQLTFQMRYLNNERVEICEDALFFVDPVESVDKLYTQRQRWQRGSLEVAHLFPQSALRPTRAFTDINIYTLMFDHTFAFPRMIWYVALICLMALNTSAKIVILSVLLIFALYILVGYFYFIHIALFLKMDDELRKYYLKQWWIVLLMPFYNSVMFFVRFAAIINSIDVVASWKARTLTEERSAFGKALREETHNVGKPLSWLRRKTNVAEDEPASRPLVRRRVPWYVFVGLLWFVAVALFAIFAWVSSTFGVALSEIINTLTGPLKGTSNDTLFSGLRFCIPIFVVALAAVIGASVLDRRHALKLEASGEKYASAANLLAHRAVIAGGACLLVAALMFANVKFDVAGYIASNSSTTQLFETYYVDPDSVAITDEDGNAKNVLCIYLESMETTYASEDEGGNQEVSYMPNLVELANENLSFSDTDGLGGIHTVNNTGRTMAAMLATTSGVPYELPADANSIEGGDTFASQLTTLGDVLAEKGYTQEFLCGSDADFGGRKAYFQQHGSYDIFDLQTARDKHYIASDYFDGWWGFEDFTLFDIAKDELTRLAAEDEPFNLTMLTVDAHHVNGHVCDLCEDTYNDQCANVISCTDRQMGEFISWCKEQSWYEDTVIVIMGDHPRMDTSLVSGVDYYDRTVYNCFINSAQQSTSSTNREISHMDMFPTILAAMGFEIEGDRLGLGVNLFSDQATIMEQKGYDWLNTECAKSSDYYVANFAPELIGYKADEVTESDDVATPGDAQAGQD